MHMRRLTALTGLRSNPLAGIEVVGIEHVQACSPELPDLGSNPLAGIEVVGIE